MLAAHGNEDSGSGGRSVVPEDPQLREAQVVWYHGWTVPRNWQAQPGTVGILRLEEGHRANVTISDVQTLQPYQAFHTTAVRSH